MHLSVQTTHRHELSVFVVTNAVLMQVRVGALVQGVLDISAASPRRYFFEVLQHFATSELEVDRLEYFATPAGRDDLYTYNQKEGPFDPCYFCPLVCDQSLMSG